jgi:hypothetical protein
MIFPEDVLSIIVLRNSGEQKQDHKVEIKNPNKEILKSLIEKVGDRISGERESRDIVNEFLKTLLIEQ